MSGGSDDVVERVDRKIHDILVHIAETTTDDAQREVARDLMLTLPPVSDWPQTAFHAMSELAAVIERNRAGISCHVFPDSGLASDGSHVFVDCSHLSPNRTAARHRLSAD